MKRKSFQIATFRFAIAALCLVLQVTHAHAVPEIPGAPQAQPIALTGGVIHPVSGGDLRDMTLLFDKGKIIAIGKDIPLPEGTQQIPLNGLHVYPSMIDADTQMGLVEIPSVRATRDLAEVGSINPNVKAQVAFNPDSELIPVTRSNGVLVVLTVPTGGLVSGTSAVMQLDGWSWEDMTVRADVAMHVQWPFFSLDQPESRRTALEELRKTLDMARAYQTASKAAGQGSGPAPEFDVRMEALLPVLDGRIKVIAHADEIQQIQSAVSFAKEQGLQLIIEGGYDAPLCAELLKEQQVPVIVGGVHRLPLRRADPYDTAFTVPAKLHEAGVKYCISGKERTANTRNLPYHASTAAAYGLSPEEALKSVTLYPAEILGVSDRLGSLEAGKDATLIITTGDPLEISSQVTMAFVQGRQVDLNNRHKRLWEKYKEKYRRQGIQQ